MSEDLTKKLGDLKGRHRVIENKKIEAEAEVKHLSQTKEELTAEMKDKFGVGTVEELRELHEKMRSEDEAKVEEFGQSIASVEKKLSELQES